VKCGEGQKALQHFQQMQQEGVQPDPVTFVVVLNACASLQALEEGSRIYEEIIQSSCKSDAFVIGSLVDVYAKCGNMENACKVFDKMLLRDVVTWNAVIFGYVKCGQGQKALELF
jgi:pentatricopeptide repeat protein